jgi:hypothetical protein
MALESTPKVDTMVTHSKQPRSIAMLKLYMISWLEELA